MNNETTHTAGSLQHKPVITKNDKSPQIVLQTADLIVVDPRQFTFMKDIETGTSYAKKWKNPETAIAIKNFDDIKYMNMIHFKTLNNSECKVNRFAVDFLYIEKDYGKPEYIANFYNGDSIKISKEEYEKCCEKMGYVSKCDDSKSYTQEYAIKASCEHIKFEIKILSKVESDLVEVSNKLFIESEQGNVINKAIFDGYVIEFDSINYKYYLRDMLYNKHLDITEKVISKECLNSFSDTFKFWCPYTEVIVYAEPKYISIKDREHNIIVIMGNLQYETIPYHIDRINNWKQNFYNEKWKNEKKQWKKSRRDKK